MGVVDERGYGLALLGSVTWIVHDAIPQFAVGVKVAIVPPAVTVPFATLLALNDELLV